MVPGLEIVQLETPVHCIECGRAGHGFWSLGWNSVFASEELGDLGLLTAPPVPQLPRLSVLELLEGRAASFLHFTGGDVLHVAPDACRS